METSSKILDQVRKLLNVTAENGASKGEIENALVLAQRMMQKYNIDQSELFMSVNDIDQTLIENKFKHGEAKFWIWDLLCIVGKGYNCTVLRKGYTDHYFWKIVGFEQDRKMVVNLYETILPLIRNLVKQRFEANKEYNNTSKGIFTRSYIEGFLKGLNYRLQNDKEIYLKLEDKTKYELIVIKKDDLINDWIDRERKGKPLKSASSSPRKREEDENAFSFGYQDGVTENLNKELGCSNT